MTYDVGAAPAASSYLYSLYAGQQLSIRRPAAIYTPASSCMLFMRYIYIRRPAASSQQL
jgi:hypothetical protein